MSKRRATVITVLLLLGAVLQRVAPASAADPVIVAAGDIASCSSTGDTATAVLLDSLPGTVLTLGDEAYESGTSAELANCYDPTWGRRFADTKPVPGNHEFNSAGAAGYYGYFGAAAGDAAKGYYSYDVGTWHMIAINSNCSAIGGCGTGSRQETWLRADLAAHPAACTLAYWHHPLFSSGQHGNQAYMRPIWQALYEAGADVVLNGHDHDYERFAPQTPAGVGDGASGMREIVVGTGGRSHYGISAGITNSEVRNGVAYGVLTMTLHLTGYDWQFVPVAGQTFTDSGSGLCHGVPPNPVASIGSPAIESPTGLDDGDDGDQVAAGDSSADVWTPVVIAAAIVSVGGAGIFVWRRKRRRRAD